MSFRLAIGLLTWLAASAAAFGQPAPNHFGAKRYPFAPVLQQNFNPALCKIALEDAHTRFLQTAVDTAVTEKDANGMRWLSWDPSPELSFDSTVVQRLDLDLDGTGARQVVLYQSFVHSWRGENYYAYVARSPQVLRKMIAGSGSAQHFFAELLQHRSLVNRDARAHLDQPAVAYYPGALADRAPLWVSTGSDWEPHRLFRWRDGYYFYAQSNIGGRLFATSLELYRLRADGRVQLQCQIQIAPDEVAQSNFRSARGLGSFFKILSTIGAGGADCGTLKSGAIHDGGGRAAIDRAGFRPWAVSIANENYYRYDERMVRFMEAWSLEEIWNRREYQTFLQHVQPAKNALGKYFRERFGLPSEKARSEAQRVIEELIGAWLLLPKDYEGGARVPTLSEALLKFDAHELRVAIDKHRTNSRSEAELAEISNALHDAVEWPAGLEMLAEAGANVNRPRDTGANYGKTALMMASHMNRPDAVKILLKHGADPNARTQAVQEACVITIERGRRSALMYAAENAGPEVIAVLLEAGADPSARDSKGNGIDFYLAMNPRFTKEHTAAGIKKLVATRRPSSKGPGFDCLRATSPVEKRICRDEILSMLDAEMSEAYGRWQRVDAEARADQLRWLQERDASCLASDPAKLTGCLQQSTRARVRYMHNRIAESTVAGG